MKCPFCNAELPNEGAACEYCHRPPSLPRKVCAACQGWTPRNEPLCCRCGKAFKSDLRWKVPLIIAIFVVAIAVSVLIRVMAR